LLGGIQGKKSRRTRTKKKGIRGSENEVIGCGTWKVIQTSGITRSNPTPDPSQCKKRNARNVSNAQKHPKRVGKVWRLTREGRRDQRNPREVGEVAT